MPLTITTESNAGELTVTFAGVYTFTELKDLIEVIKAAADRAGCDRALLDARDVAGQMTESEKFFVGSKIAEVFGSKLKAAIVMPPGDVTKMGEMAAVNRGARILVTESYDDAAAWLQNSRQQTTA
jgi:hypothetical protein